MKANELLITTPHNFHEWTWPTTAQIILDCHVKILELYKDEFFYNNLRRLLALKPNELLITTPHNFHEWTWPTTAQLLLECHVKILELDKEEFFYNNLRRLLALKANE
jgi:hypothetical protein